MLLGLYRTGLKYLEETHVKVFNLKVAVAVSQTCKEYQHLIYESPTTGHKTTCTFCSSEDAMVTKQTREIREHNPDSFV